MERCLKKIPYTVTGVLGVLLFSAFLITFVRSNGGKAIKDISDSLFFQSPRTDVTRDIGGLFHWQSTLVNLFSFINIGLFLYFIQRYYNLSPAGFPSAINLGALFSHSCICNNYQTLYLHFSRKSEWRTGGFPRIFVQSLSDVPVTWSVLFRNFNYPLLYLIHKA